ncbi:MAG: hypothetical protein ACLPH3_21745 [Terracidiphilus sp.]
MATDQSEEPFAQMPAGAFAREQGSTSASTERQRDERWMKRDEDIWQHRLETLQQCVCELLIKNQQLRMALSATVEPGRACRDASNILG